MRNEKQYNEIVDLILDAYSERKLKHGNPCGCFIGNIVAKKCDVKRPHLGSFSLDYVPDWYQVIHSMKHNGSICSLYGSIEEGEKQIQEIGYTIEEVMSLEKAFEEAICKEEIIHKFSGTGYTQYEGMKAALNKLAEIHNTPSMPSIEKLDKIQELVYN